MGGTFPRNRSEHYEDVDEALKDRKKMKRDQEERERNRRKKLEKFKRDREKM
jgi:hypothetical protein